MPEFELPPEVAAVLPPEALVPPLDVLLEGVDAETRAAVSPVAHVHAGAPPFLLLHGTADTVVPYAQSELLAEALQAVGADVRLEPRRPAREHGWDGCPEADAIVRRSVDFLAAALHRTVRVTPAGTRVDQADAGAGTGTERRAGHRLRVALMTVLDVSVVTVALPAIRDDLGLSASGLQWVVNAYSLTFAGFLLLGGRAADLLGRKRVFLFGLVVFTAASLAGGLAQAGWQLVAARAVQGVGGAVLAPVTLSLLTTTFREPAEKARALGTWSAVAGLGGALGGVVGGRADRPAELALGADRQRAGRRRAGRRLDLGAGPGLAPAGPRAARPAGLGRGDAGHRRPGRRHHRRGGSTAGARPEDGRPCSAARCSPSSSSCWSSGVPRHRWSRCRCSGSARWWSPTRSRCSPAACCPRPSSSSRCTCRRSADSARWRPG